MYSLRAPKLPSTRSMTQLQPVATLDNVNYKEKHQTWLPEGLSILGNSLGLAANISEDIKTIQARYKVPEMIINNVQHIRPSTASTDNARRLNPTL